MISTKRAEPRAGWDTHVHVFDQAAPIAKGHYAPLHKPLAAIEALALKNGFDRLVLVQPSVYGSNNTVLLQALEQAAGRHRGVVVLDSTITDAELTRMQALGVRGVRFNLVSPLSNATATDIRRTFDALAPRLRALGWHVQWYAAPEDLPMIAALHDGPTGWGVPAVLDHLAGMHTQLPVDDPAWAVLSGMAQAGAWIKLSGWYRLQAEAPYTTLDPVTQRVAQLFTKRMVWGSDWPHTSFAPQSEPAYESTWQPVARVLTAAQQRDAAETAPAILYR